MTFLLLLLAAAPLERQLVRNTQELFDAVASGNQEPWKKYFADDCLYFDEKGRSMDKAALVKDVTPLPSGYSGTIRVVHSRFLVVGGTAIHSYDLDETETIFGQEVTARYHATDTWLRRSGRWQIAAGQVLRYYEDPAPGVADLKKLADYAGTYQLGPERTMAVTAEGDRLYAQSGDRPKELLVPEAADIFFRKGVEGRRLFRTDADGKVDALIDRRNNEDVVWRRVK